MIILIFCVCFSASTIGGICGIGGGVVIKPVLDTIAVMNVSTLSFLSGLTVFAMAIVNVWKNHQSKSIDMKHSLPLGIGAALGGTTGKQVFQILKSAVGSDQLLGFTHSIVLALLVLGTFVYTRNKTQCKSYHVHNPWLCVVLGSALGMLSSFLGIGGGPMNLAVLCFFFSMDTKQASVNSLIVILISQMASLCTTILTSTVPPFEWDILAAMIFAGILGGELSAKIHKEILSFHIDKLFSALLILFFLFVFTMHCEQFLYFKISWRNRGNIEKLIKKICHLQIWKVAYFYTIFKYLYVVGLLNPHTLASSLTFILPAAYAG